MSLWDIVAGISTAETLEHPNSKWKKINSVSTSLINGDQLAYINEGGSTKNIFGANTSFVCDWESLLEGVLGPEKIWTEILAGLAFGPGSDNGILIGNKNALNYLVGHSHNFQVMRGHKALSYTYSPGSKAGPDGNPVNSTGYISNKRNKLIWLAIGAFAMMVAGFDIALNVKKNKLISQEEAVREDEAEIEKYKAIVEAEQKDAEAHGQVVNPDAGGNSPEPTKAQEELEDAQHQYHTDEGTLKKTESSYEWTIFSNIVAENRGYWLLKFLEQLCGTVSTVEVELKNIKNTVTKIGEDTNTEAEKANLETAIKNLEENVKSISELIALNPSDKLLKDLAEQKKITENLANELRERIDNLETYVLGLNLPGWPNDI